MNTKENKGRLIIVSKTRFITASVLTLILLSMFFSFLTGSEISSAESLTRYKTVKVIQGDTLWEIAKENKAPEQDIREFIFEIKTENGLKSAEIYPGQNLVIPISSAK